MTTIFQNIFGAAWDDLPVVMQRHYANRGYSGDCTMVEGTLNIELSPLAKILAPLFGLTGTLAPRAGKNIPVTVRFLSENDNDHFIFDRVFHYPNRKPYHFYSRLIPDGREMVEMTGAGIGWRASYAWNGSKIILTHRGYALRIFGKFIPLPITWLIGRAHAEETPIDDNRFAMRMEIRHPLWGRIFRYGGEFRITEDAGAATRA